MTTDPKTKTITGRGSLAERTPFHVTPEELDQWIKQNFPMETAEDAERLKLALEAGDKDLREQFRKTGWTITD